MVAQTSVGGGHKKQKGIQDEMPSVSTLKSKMAPKAERDEQGGRCGETLPLPPKVQEGLTHKGNHVFAFPPTLFHMSGTHYLGVS